jgi:hypothetical protein
MKKPLRCLLTFHEWRLVVNDEGQRYKTCARCGAYRNFDPRPTMGSHGEIPTCATAFAYGIAA